MIINAKFATVGYTVQAAFGFVHIKLSQALRYFEKALKMLESWL